MSEWNKVKIADVCTIEKGSTGLASAIPGKYPIVTTGADRKICADYQFDTEAVCIPLVSSTGHGKKTLNYVHFQSGKFALGTILAAVIPKDNKQLSARFLHLYLSHFKDSVLVPLMKGAANVSLPMGGIAGVEIPLPPIARQLAVVDLVERLEDEHAEFENEGKTQATILKQLRQAILQEAVEGKLTADWRRKNPARKGDPEFDAGALLENIKVEKVKLISEGKASKEKPFAPIELKDKPFQLPEGWAWCRLGEIIVYTDNLDIHKNLPPDKIISYVDINSIDNHKHRIREIKKKAVSELSSRARRVLRKGYIIYSTVRPYLENIAHIDEDIEYCIGSTGFNVFKTVIAENNSIFNFLLSPVLNEQFKKNMIGFNSPSITNDQFENTLFPLAPLAEQLAINSRVNTLMSSLDELENQITERQSQTEVLMQSVLREAFEMRAA